MRTVAVVLAAGSGLRFGAALPKQLLPLAGRALLEHSVAAFDQAPGVDATLVVMAPGHAAQVRELLAVGGYRKVTGIIEGGTTRPESARRAIDALGPGEGNVLFHDAARPLLDQATIAACVSALDTYEAVGVAVPTSDDCGVVLRYLPDVPVAVVRGSERNIKITYPGDLSIAEVLLSAGPDEDTAGDQ
jgi:2-C-methyl-D-erythritol 4-phosphate cytidylyltransferase